MSLRVIGAGFGRTGTESLKLALERLLGGACYHMGETIKHPEHVPLWHGATLGKMPTWEELLADYEATVDWPAAAFWPELSEVWPRALVLLSVREPEAWWKSANSTIFRSGDNPARTDQWKEMIRALNASHWIPDQEDSAAAIAAFMTWNERVRQTVPPERLLVWQPEDGWEPICRALSLAIPSEPFPHTNKAGEWLRRNRMERDG